MKLELKHLAAYLDHKIECSYKEYEDEKKRLKAYFTGVSRTDGIETTYKRKREGCSGDYIGFDGNNNINDLEFKLHLRPLSDLTKEIEVNGEKFVPWEVLRGIYDEFDINKDPEDLDDLLIISGQGHYDEITFDSINNAFQKLYSWHFDLHNLIKNGLAIDINTLNK